MDNLGEVIYFSVLNNKLEYQVKDICFGQFKIIVKWQTPSKYCECYIPLNVFVTMFILYE